MSRAEPARRALAPHRPPGPILEPPSGALGACQVVANGHLEVERRCEVERRIPLFIQFECVTSGRDARRRVGDLELFIGRRLRFSELRRLQLGESVYLGDF